jgi:hypothetical protein
MSTATGINKTIFTTVLRGGGWWDADEVANDLCDDTDKIRKLLGDMVDRGYLERRPKPGTVNRVQFGVTMACMVPQGLELGQLLELSGKVTA